MADQVDLINRGSQPGQNDQADPNVRIEQTGRLDQPDHRDHLDYLIARRRNLGAVIQPRPVSHFEPPPTIDTFPAAFPQWSDPLAIAATEEAKSGDAGNAPLLTTPHLTRLSSPKILPAHSPILQRKAHPNSMSGTIADSVPVESQPLSHTNEVAAPLRTPAIAETESTTTIVRNRNRQPEPFAIPESPRPPSTLYPPAPSDPTQPPSRGAPQTVFFSSDKMALDSAPTPPAALPSSPGATASESRHTGHITRNRAAKSMPFTNPEGLPTITEAPPSPATPTGDKRMTPRVIALERESPPTDRPETIAPQRIIARPEVNVIESSPTAPAPQPRQAVHQPAGESQTAPTIHVTIGRVEVRAIPSTPRFTHEQPAPQTRTNPVIMSLDEYLHRREQGERL